MLRESILMMVMFNRDTEGVSGDILKLAEQHDHDHADVPPHLYNLWLDSLCEAIQKHDPEYTPELANSWRDAMLPGIEMMISKY